jgi:hypothetical protein
MHYVIQKELCICTDTSENGLGGYFLWTLEAAKLYDLQQMPCFRTTCHIAIDRQQSISRHSFV